MPRITVRKLAIAAVASTALATVNLWQIPAQAGYGPPPPPSPPPGGFVRVVTSRTIGPAGGRICPVRVDRSRVCLIVPRRAFSVPMQITITAPNLRRLGDAGHPGFRAISGVGILIQINGTTYTGPFNRRLVLRITRRGIRPRDRVVVWDGHRFGFFPAHEFGHTERTTFPSGADQDFAILAPVRSRSARHQTPAHGIAVVHPARTAHVVLASLFLAPVSTAPAGVGVLAPGPTAAGGR